MLGVSSSRFRQLELPHPILTNEDMKRPADREVQPFQGGRAAGRVHVQRREPRRHLAEALTELVDAGERAIEDSGPRC